MKIVKILGVSTLTLMPITTVVACSDEEARNYYLLDDFINMNGLYDEMPEKQAYNTKKLDNIYEKYVTDENYLDLDALDKDSFKGIGSRSKDNPIFQNISDLNAMLEKPYHEKHTFIEHHNHKPLKVEINDVNKSINGEFENLNIYDIDTNLASPYEDLDFNNEFLRLYNDIENVGYDIPVFNASVNIGGLIIGKNITHIPERMFNNISWSHTHPIQFESDSNIETIKERSIRLPYPSRLSSYDFSNFSSLKSIEGLGFGINMDAGEDEDGNALPDHEWTDEEKVILKLPKQDIMMSDYAFHNSPINEIHYYSEHHTVIDHNGSEVDIDNIIGSYNPDIILIDLSDPANAGYLPN